MSGYCQECGQTICACSEVPGESVKLDPFHWHEMLDRIHLLRTSFYSYVVFHPCGSHPKLQKKVQRVALLMSRLYQEAGIVEHEENKND